MNTSLNSSVHKDSSAHKDSSLCKSRLHQGYYRNGQNHRAGADVSFGDIVKIFGFRSIEIGRWVTAEEQQIAANLFFDALSDLMDILQVPMQVISLNSSLSLSFGKGGQKHSCAHYNSAKRQLALAKNAGGGALAHEWFHAFDHYICKRMFAIKQPHLFATEVWLNEMDTLVDHPLNQLLNSAFEAIFLNKHGQPSNLVSASVKVDSSQSIFYYARPQELGARSFECMIQSADIKNSFLAAGTLKSKEAKMGLYPSGDVLANVSRYFLTYFMTLGRALSQ